jgi:hypothetical protein
MAPFRNGQKVVCINEGPDWMFRDTQIKKGRVYTVKDNLKVLGIDGITLYEVECKTAPGWTKSWFKPACNKKTDIRVFTRMLKKRPEKA